MMQTLAALALLVAVPVQDAPPELAGAGWVNTPGLSLDRLKGKAVVLYFFEEG
jgi:hypothetical protein